MHEHVSFPILAMRRAIKNIIKKLFKTQTEKPTKNNIKCLPFGLLPPSGNPRSELT